MRGCKLGGKIGRLGFLAPLGVSVMYELLDYHRTVVAFHGTRTMEADRLVGGLPFKFSDNTDDWLGGGIYLIGLRPDQECQADLEKELDL
jgi:hypothetical protein